LPRRLANISRLLVPNNDASIAESSEVTGDVLKALAHCPTHSYFIVEQPGVSSNDYADGRAAPQLSRYMAGKHEEVKTAMAIPEIVGHVDSAAIAKQLQSSCGDDWLLKKIASKSPDTDNARRVQQLQSDGRTWYQE
jgi:hypothetical protein